MYSYICIYISHKLNFFPKTPQFSVLECLARDEFRYSLCSLRLRRRVLMSSYKEIEKCLNCAHLPRSIEPVIPYSNS